MQEPDCVDIEVFVGVDIAKGDHYACVVTTGRSAPVPRIGTLCTRQCSLLVVLPLNGRDADLAAARAAKNC